MNKELLMKTLKLLADVVGIMNRSLPYSDAKMYCNQRLQEIDKTIAELLLNEQPEAITDDAHFCKHDVSGSAASENTSDVSDHPSASTSETATVSGNEQTKELCPKCGCSDYFKNRITGVYYCTCGMTWT